MNKGCRTALTDRRPPHPPPPTAEKIILWSPCYSLPIGDEKSFERPSFYQLQSTLPWVISCVRLPLAGFGWFYCVVACCGDFLWSTFTYLTEPLYHFESSWHFKWSMYCWSGHNSVGLRGLNRKDPIANPTRFFHLCLAHHCLLFSLRCSFYCIGFVE